jgi:hypothetical protein
LIIRVPLVHGTGTTISIVDIWSKSRLFSFMTFSSVFHRGSSPNIRIVFFGASGIFSLSPGVSRNCIVFHQIRYLGVVFSISWEIKKIKNLYWGRTDWHYIFNRVILHNIFDHFSDDFCLHSCIEWVEPIDCCFDINSSSITLYFSYLYLEHFLEFSLGICKILS